MPADSTRCRATLLSTGGEPSISPDGRRIAFVKWNDVWVYDLERATARRVCKNANPHGIAWNPEGTLLAFQGADSLQVTAEFWIWVVNPDGTGLRKVSTGPDDQHPIWTLDGRSLVWTRAGRLWQADTSGLAGRFLTRKPAPYVLEYARAWTEDGSHLLFMRRSTMGEEFRLRQIGRDSTDDVADSTRVGIVGRWELGVEAGGRLLYSRANNTAGNTIRLFERGPKGRVRSYFVQDSVNVWLIDVARDRSFAVVDDGGDEETEARLWLVPLRVRP